jgi:RNA polymerase sigma-70 factor (ECF subfamily)
VGSEKTDEAGNHALPVPTAPGESNVPSREEGSAVLSIESLIQEHNAPLYRYAFRLTGNTADAEDLVQQAFMTAFRKLDQVREPERISAWLYAVLRSCFLKSVRKPRPQPAGTLELNLDQLPDRSPAPAAVEGDQLQLALEELPPEYKLVVLMFYFEHQSYKQIAEQLDMPLGTVMSRLARAKQRLRARLGEETSSSVRLAERTERKPDRTASPAPSGRGPGT